MIFLLSPAKSLDYETPLQGQPHTQALFGAQSKALIALLRSYTPAQIAALMELSDTLAALNVARYAAWSPRASAKNARQAVLAFNGDVYDGLDAHSLEPQSLDWAQAHVCILSGLYGVLRPLDLMQPYRLEMGTRLPGPHGKDVYQFWGRRIADYLNTRLQADATPVVVNLASAEYFKSVDLQALKGRVVECVFQEYKDGNYKIISFFAKRARGQMARYAIEQQLRTPEQLKNFDRDGYAYASEASTPERLVFRRNRPLTPAQTA